MSEQVREEMEVDVIFIGAGIANLSAAYSLMQQIEAYNSTVEDTETPSIEDPIILVIDKGSKPGSHILSGAVVDPIAFHELFPELGESDFPFTTPVKKEKVQFLTKSKNFSIPHRLLPKEMRSNDGCYLGSLAEMTEWMAGKCEEIGVEVYTEFSGTKLLYEEDKVIGVRLGDTGLLHDGEQGPAYAPGMNVFAKTTVLGEGSCGNLSQELIKKFNLDEDANSQVWALGIKELIKIPKGRLSQGEVLHTFGYPLRSDNYGGSFLYAYQEDLIGIGLVIGLDFSDSSLNVHEAFLQFKKHPKIAKLIEGCEVIEYGAKTLPEGGYFSIPQLAVDGAVMVGDSAGLLNAMRLKGIHLAMKSGMLAAQKIYTCLKNDSFLASDLDYRKEFDESWAGQELMGSKNYRQGFHRGLIPGMISTGLHLLSGGKFPLGRKTIPADYSTMKEGGIKQIAEKIKTDQNLYLDITGDIYLSGTMHREDEPSHISFRDDELLAEDHRRFDSPSTRFCPAEVYEKQVDEQNNFSGIRINFSNCLHCKTCVIKDPLQNITWTPPEGGEGPKYKNM